MASRVFERNKDLAMESIKVSDKQAAVKAVDILRKGGLVVYPTETVYGIGADATNTEAIEKLNKYKKRPMGKPYSVAVENQEMAERYADLNKTAKDLYDKFLPGPVTIISKAKQNLAKGVISETGTIGMRIPDYPLVIEIVKRLGRPITATSANSSYKKRPYKISDILENISKKQGSLIDLIIDAGMLPHNEPSTVVDTTMDDPIILRQGDIKLKDKNEVMSKSEENTKNIGKELWQKYEQYAGERAIVFALEGPMGAGKTQFTKGLAKAMGIKEDVVSPTFNLELQYSTPHLSSITGEKNYLFLNHYDAWRLKESGELEALGLAKNISDKSVVVVEWADRVTDEIRKYNEEAIVVWVKINYPSASTRQAGRENERIISWGVV